MMISIELDLNLKIIEISTSQKTLLGLNTSDLLGRDYEVILEKINSNLVLSFYQWANHHEESEHFSYDRLLQTGEHVVIDAYKLHDKILIFINYKSKLNVKENFNRKFKTFFIDHFEGGVLFLEKDGSILECSNEVLNLFRLKDHNGVQFSREGLIDKSFFTLLEINNYSNIAIIIKEMLIKSNKISEDTLSDDIAILNKTCKLFVSPMFVQNQTIGYYIFIHDLTLLREQDKLIEWQRASLVSSSKHAALGVMASGIAHEINNPLTIISANNRLLRKMFDTASTDTEKLYHLNDNINLLITRISKIIRGLQIISRDGSNEDFSTCKLVDILSDALSLCSEKFKNNGVEIKIDLESDVYQTKIYCCRVQISQVFLNLTGNSFDAVINLPTPWIEIICKIENQCVVFYFLDSGQGIPENIQEKIFQPFFTTKEVGKGTGLGLSLSYSMIKNHYGELKLDSSLKNTCFVVTLPIKRKTNDLSARTKYITD